MLRDVFIERIIIHFLKYHIKDDHTPSSMVTNGGPLTNQPHVALWEGYTTSSALDSLPVIARTATETGQFTIIINYSLYYTQKKFVRKFALTMYFGPNISSPLAVLTI